MKNRVMQAAVCGLVLFGMAADASPAVREIPEAEDGYSVQETILRIAGPLRIIHQICDTVGEYNSMDVLAPHRVRLSVDHFLDRLEAYAELYCEGNRSAVEAVSAILDIGGHVCLGQYDKNEIRVVEDVVYDSEGGVYHQYKFYLPSQPEPAALVVESVGDYGLLYAECGTQFWTNDPEGTAMPEVHSFLKENKCVLQEYFEITNPNGTYEVVYRGMEKKDELKIYQALHYSVTENVAGREEGTWEVYVDRSYLNIDLIYVQTAKESYEKWALRNWESPDDHSYTFACSRAFQIEEDGVWIEKDWEINVFKDGEFQECLNVSGEEAFFAYADICVKDYNFDDIPDIAVIWGTPANWGGKSTDIYIRDEEGGCYYARTFIDNPYRNTGTGTIYTFARGSACSYYYNAYQYRDGVFVDVGSLAEEYTEEGSVIYTVRDEAGNEEVYRDELPDKWREFWN